LLNKAIEDLYPELFQHDTFNVATANQTSSDILALELANCRSDKTTNKCVMSVNTGIKGLCLVKILNDTICPLKLVCSIFDSILESKRPVSRYIIRIIPLVKTFYPNIEELSDNMSAFLKSLFPSTSENAVLESDVPATACYVETSIDETSSKRIRLDIAKEASDSISGIAELTKDESVPSAQTELVGMNLISNTDTLTQVLCPSYSAATYCVQFKRRNHDVLVRDSVQDLVRSQIPRMYRVNYKTPKVCKYYSCCNNINYCYYDKCYHKVLKLKEMLRLAGLTT